MEVVRNLESNVSSVGSSVRWGQLVVRVMVSVVKERERLG